MEVVKRVIEGVVKLGHGTPDNLPYGIAYHTWERYIWEGWVG